MKIKLWGNTVFNLKQFSRYVLKIRISFRDIDRKSYAKHALALSLYNDNKGD